MIALNPMNDAEVAIPAWHISGKTDEQFVNLKVSYKRVAVSIRVEGEMCEHHFDIPVYQDSKALKVGDEVIYLKKEVHSQARNKCVVLGVPDSKRQRKV